MQMSIRSAGGAYWSWRWQLREGVRWRIAVDVQTRRSVNYVSRRRLLELAMAAVGGIALAHCRWTLTYANVN